MARSEKVKEITALHYEAGNQAKCYKAVWRRWIEPEFGICYRTFLNMLGLSLHGQSGEPISPEDEQESTQNNFPSLFDSD